MYFAVSISEYERSLLAGFLEGEATLSISEMNGGQSLSCSMYLRQRDDEQDTMEWLLALTGLGRIHRVPARATSKPQLCWAIDAQEDCLELLGMIESCGFHGRRAAELRLWSDAVRVWTGSGGAARRSELRRLKTGLAAARRFGGGEQCASRWDTHRQFLGYISGFVCAEGCFGLSDGRPRFSVHLRRDDESLLQLLSEETGLGNVTRYRPAPPLNPSATWTITRRSELGELRDLLWKAGLPGRKLREMDMWGAAVDEYARAKRLGRSPRLALIERARERLAAARAYRPPEGGQLLELSRRDVQSESLEALRQWSLEEVGPLSCPKYARWRARGSRQPTRNTIVRHFGSWNQALAAAGLGARIARAPRPAGGEERRQAHRREQRAKVAAAVQRFEREHGWRPGAGEFFRWRLESVVDAPTQSTVYRLFPGGWAEVLQVAGATV